MEWIKITKTNIVPENNGVYWVKVKTRIWQLQMK